jgi:hypothetical protein
MSDEVPACPGCSKSDRVEKIPGYSLPDEDLSTWWCSRCVGRLSALPSLPAGRATAPEPAPKRRRKRKEVGGE